MNKTLLLMISSSVFAMGQVFLIDLINNSERIPVSFNTASIISRVPHVPNTARELNIKPFSRTLSFKIVEAAVVELNSAFKTEKFYRLTTTYDKAEDFQKEGYRMWVILDPQGNYSIVSPNGTLRFDMSLRQAFYYIDTQTKVRVLKNGLKTINGTCRGDEVFINLYLDSMISKLPASCAFEKIMEDYKKKIIKFADAQFLKVEK
ncbi:MAG: hypothetical protein A2096_17840 [Spirochaetes bacterium GWF1_41_5]|nr:MAG: hypothetical protein A2096_17840 [Spirochaetes bacterium GWF1_41_5]